VAQEGFRRKFGLERPAASIKGIFLGTCETATGPWNAVRSWGCDAIGKRDQKTILLFGKYERFIQYGENLKRETAVDRLLILSCSQRKASGRGDLRAIDRYDGPAFRVLRRYLQAHPDDPLAVLILSAKFGLIESQREIPWYDERLSPASAVKLRPQVAEAAARVFRSRPWQAIGICAGREYRSALEGAAELLPPGAQVHVLAGGLGKRLSALRDWLWQAGAEGRVGKPRRGHGHKRQGHRAGPFSG
jgi:hypothetical protein